VAEDSTGSRRLSIEAGRVDRATDEGGKAVDCCLDGGPLRRIELDGEVDLEGRPPLDIMAPVGPDDEAVADDDMAKDDLRDPRTRREIRVERVGQIPERDEELVVVWQEVDDRRAEAFDRLCR